MGFLLVESICRAAVDEGSKPAWAGVTRALRFWTMESSMVLRDNRKKSVLEEAKSDSTILLIDHGSGGRFYRVVLSH